MPSYLLLRDQVESGPFSFDELKEAGLNSTDLIWVEGQSTEWKYADEIKKLRDIVRYASAIRNDHPEIVDPPQVDIPRIDAPQIDTGKIHHENNFVNEIVTDDKAVAKIIKVIIADDHGLFRQGVRMALAHKKDIAIVGEAENGMQLMHLLKHNLPDVILLDIQMPIMDGISALTSIRKNYGDMKVIMLSMYNDHSMVTTLMETGANAYLTKTADSESIYEAIKACYAKSFYFNDLTNLSMLEKLRSVKKAPEKPLVPKIENPVHVFKAHDLKINTQHEVLPKIKKQVLIFSSSILLIISGLMAGISIFKHTAQKKEIPEISKQRELQSAIIPDAGKAPNNKEITKKQRVVPVSKLDSGINLESIQNNLFEINNKKPVEQKNILNFVTAHIDKFKSGKTEGLSEIHLKIHNKTSYTLDLVVVKVRYIRSDSSLFKTEYMKIKNIAPYSSKLVKAPNSPVGARIKCRITAVKSKQLELE